MSPAPTANGSSEPSGDPPDPPPPAPELPTDDNNGAGRSNMPSNNLSRRTGPSKDERPIWRASRPPLDWAPLGTYAGDYPPAPADTDPDPGELLLPRLFPDHHRPPENTNPDDAPPDRRTAATKRAQALSIILTQFLASGHAPTQAGEPAQLLVTIDEQSLRDRTGHGTLASGTPLPITQVRMLACHAGIIPTVLSGTSETLDIGRSSRTFNTAIQRAITLRDQGCVFPGCTMPAKWSEFHHITFWKNGGTTTYNNCAQLCRRHHHLIHQEQWTLRINPTDGHPELIPPTDIDPEQKPLRNTKHRTKKFEWPTDQDDKHGPGASAW